MTIFLGFALLVIKDIHWLETIVQFFTYDLFKNWLSAKYNFLPFLQFVKFQINIINSNLKSLLK